MNPYLFKYPPQAAFGQNIAKSKVYTHARAGKKVQRLFVDFVESIVWQYKLAPETVNIQASEGIEEIQVFTLHLKNAHISPAALLDIVCTIDGAIPFPIIFEVQSHDEIMVMAAHKRASYDDNVCLSDYLMSEWLPQTSARVALPVVLHMHELYAALLKPLARYPQRARESLADWMHRLGHITHIEHDIQKLEAKMHREKQFNRKVALNQELRTTRELLASLL